MRFLVCKVCMSFLKSKTARSVSVRLQSFTLLDQPLGHGAVQGHLVRNPPLRCLQKGAEQSSMRVDVGPLDLRAKQPQFPRLAVGDFQVMVQDLEKVILREIAATSADHEWKRNKYVKRESQRDNAFEPEWIRNKYVKRMSAKLHAAATCF